MLRTLFALTLCLPLVTAQVPEAEPEPPTERFEYQRDDVMGVSARVVIHADTRAQADAGAERVWQRLEELDKALSAWRPDSEVIALGKRAGGPAVAVSDDLYTVLEISHQLAKLSKGVFDPTLGPLVKLWRGAAQDGVPPDADRIAEVSQEIGWRNLLVDRRARTVRLLKGGMALDLDAIAGGYAARQALAALEQLDLSHSFIELGTDIAAGRKPHGAPGWDVSVQFGDGPPRPLRVLQSVLSVSDGSVSLFEHAGRRYAPILDPRSGQAVTRPMAVAVVSRDGAWADGLTSALAVLGPRAGRQLVEQAPSSTVLILEDMRHPAMTLLHDEQGLGGWIVPEDIEGHWTGAGPWLVGLPKTLHGSGHLISAGAYTRWAMEVMVQRVGDMAPYIVPRYAEGAAPLELMGRSGKWHHFELRLTGFDGQLAVWRDGKPLWVEPVVIPSTGPGPLAFGFEVAREDSDGGSVGFQAPRIRPLGVFSEDLFDGRGDGVLALTDQGRSAGWVDLLGDDLGRWQAAGGGPVPDDYSLADGVLAIPSSGGADIRTLADYTDFRLRLEFRLSPGTNSGLFLRGDRSGGDAAYSGCEVQIIDDHGWESLAGSALAPTQRCGSLYAAVPAAAPGALLPAGEWNTYEVLYQGSRLAVALNGTILYDVDTLGLAAKPPFAERAPTGFIGLQRYGAPHVEGELALWVRNAFIQELPRD